MILRAEEKDGRQNEHRTATCVIRSESLSSNTRTAIYPKRAIYYTSESDHRDVKKYCDWCLGSRTIMSVKKNGGWQVDYTQA